MQDVYYSIILLILACLEYTGISPEVLARFNIVFWIFLIALVLFSGSIYAYAITGSKSFGLVAPFGGISLMLGWVYLIYIAIRS
ncbi:MAG: DUF423 domain-containing protein [Candidatus Melainabacteria bacterium]|nr:DUF423 domain-containing protein [Candidatus Melainabacteria bacterium]